MQASLRHSLGPTTVSRQQNAVMQACPPQSGTLRASNPLNCYRTPELQGPRPVRGRANCTVPAFGIAFGIWDAAWLSGCVWGDVGGRRGNA
jgi:hypothetical protein